jgi:F-type H+-transporting ATPase subunit b
MLSARRSSNACSIGKRRDPLTASPPTASMPHHHALGTRATVLCAILALAVTIWFVPVVFAAAPQAEAPRAAAEQAAAQAAHPAEPAQAARPAESPVQAAAAEGHVAEGHGAEGAGHGEAEHEESPWAMVARLFNFVILAGGLFYLLRSPLAGFLEQRGVAVRSDLKRAADLKREAGAQIEEIDAKMKALPGEIDELKRRGADEIKAEEARIHAQAAVERNRLLDQAKREIDTQLRVAERELKKRAGELAVAVATERVKRTINEHDHARLLARYVSQVRH